MPARRLRRKLASSIGAALIDIFKTNAVDLSEAFQMFDTNGDGAFLPYHEGSFIEAALQFARICLQGPYLATNFALVSRSLT